MNNTGMPVDYTWTAQNGNKFTNRVEVKEGESVDLNALGDQIKGTYTWTNEWYLTADGKNVVADSSKHIPDGHQKTIYAKYVTVVNFNSLDNKGFDKKLSWTDPYNGQAHKDVLQLEVLKGDTLDASLTRNKVVNGANYTNFANVIKGTYTFTNNWYSDAAGTKVVTLNGSSKFTTATVNYYAYLYTVISLQAINNAGLPASFSFTDKYQANKKYTNQFTVKKGETVSTAIKRGNGQATLNALGNTIKGNYTWKNQVYTDAGGTKVLSNHDNYIPTVASQTLYAKWVSVVTIYTWRNGQYELSGGLLLNQPSASNCIISTREIIKGNKLNEFFERRENGGTYSYLLAWYDSYSYMTYLLWKGYKGTGTRLCAWDAIEQFVPTGNISMYPGD